MIALNRVSGRVFWRNCPLNWDLNYRGEPTTRKLEQLWRHRWAWVVRMKVCLVESERQKVEEKEFEEGRDWSWKPYSLCKMLRFCSVYSRKSLECFLFILIKKVHIYDAISNVKVFSILNGYKKFKFFNY